MTALHMEYGRCFRELIALSNEKIETVWNFSDQLNNENEVQVRTCDILNIEWTLETRRAES